MDFASVRVHTHAMASASARSLGAKAYTVGPHIVFEPGRYQPASPVGHELLAHELAHVAQQAASGTPVIAADRADTFWDVTEVLGGPGSILLGRYVRGHWLELLEAGARSVLGDTLASVLREFMLGYREGLASAPSEQMKRLSAKFDDLDLGDAVSLAGGFSQGVLEGLGHALKGLVEAIIALVKTLIELPELLADFLREMPQLAARLAQFVTEVRGLLHRANTMLDAFARDPAQLERLLGAARDAALGEVRARGREAAPQTLRFLEQPWGKIGEDIGDIVGQILFEVLLALGTDLIGNLAKEAAALAGRLAEGAVDAIRTIGRLLDQVLEWAQAVARRLAGETAELLNAVTGELGRLRAIFAEILEEGALADTGVGGVKIPISEAKGATALESRAVKPPTRTSPATVADLKPPKVHPSTMPKPTVANTPPRAPTATPAASHTPPHAPTPSTTATHTPPHAPRAPGTPSRFTQKEIAQELAEAQRGIGAGEKALEESGVRPRMLRKVSEHHHLFVQQLRRWFKARGIEIDRFTVELSADEHRWIHNEYRWNDLWKEFRLKNPHASPAEIVEHLELLKKQAGLEGLPVVPYPR